MTGHRVVAIEQLGASVTETIGAQIEGGAAKLAVGDVIPPGRILRVALPGVVIKLQGVAANAAPAGREGFVVDCTERTCPVRFTPSEAGRSQRGGRVVTQVKELLKRWILDVWSPGSDKPVNVAVEGTTFEVNTANAEGQFEVVVAEGVVVVTVPGSRPIRVQNGRRAVVGAGGVLRDSVAERETITRIRNRFTEVVIRERNEDAAGYGVAEPGGPLRERNIHVERVRVVQETIASGATPAEQTAILARWRKEGRRVITNAGEALAAGDAAYRDAFAAAASLDSAPQVETALNLFQLAVSMAPPSTSLHARATANTGLCLLDLGKFVEADAALTQAVAALPNEPVILGTLSRLYGDRRWGGWNLIRANEYSRRHLDAAKGRGRQLVWAGTNALRLWRYQDARRAFEDAEPLLRATGDVNEAGWALIHLGDAIRDVGTYAEAAEAYQRAVRTFEDASNGNAAALREQRNQSAALDRLADGLVAQGRTAESLALYQRSLAIAERLVAAQPDRELWQEDLAISLSSIGGVLKSSGRTGEALSLYQRSLEIKTRLAARSASREEGLSFGMDDVAGVLAQLGRTRDALDLFERSLAIRERLAAATPSRPGLQRLLAGSLDSVAATQKSLGRTTDAVALHTRSLRIKERLAAADSAVTKAQRDVAESLDNVADGLRLLGRGAEAMSYYERSLTIRERLSSADPNRTDLQQDLSRTLAAIAEARNEQGDAAGALAHYERSLKVFERLVAAEPDQSGAQLGLRDSLTGLGGLLEAQGRTREAQVHFDRAVAILDKLVAAEPERLDLQMFLANTLVLAGRPVHVTGRFAEARSRFQRALDIARKLVLAEPMRADFHHTLIGAIDNVATVGYMTGMEPQQRIALGEESVAIAERLAKAEPEVPDIQYTWSDALEDLGGTFTTVDKYAEALERYKQSLAIAEKLAADHPDRLRYQRRLASVLTSYALTAAVDRTTVETLQHLERSVTISRKLVAAAPNNPRYQLDLSGNLRQVGAMLWNLDRRLEAIPRYEESVSLAERVLAKTPDRASADAALAFALDLLANALVELKRDREALPRLEAYLAVTERRLMARSDEKKLKVDVGRAAHALAELHVRARRVPQAQANFERFAEVAVATTDASTNNATRAFIAQTLRDLGEVLRLQGLYAQSVERYEQSLAIEERVVAANPSPALQLDFAEALQRAASLHVRVNQPAQARDRLGKSVALFQQLADAAPKDWEAARRVADAEIDLSALLPSGDADSVLERALARLRSFQPDSANMQGWCLILLRRYAEARDVLATALQRTASTDEIHPYMQGNLAHAHLLDGRIDAALDLYRQVRAHPAAARGTMDDFDDFAKRGLPTAGFERARAVLSGK